MAVLKVNVYIVCSYFANIYLAILVLVILL